MKPAKEKGMNVKHETYVNQDVLRMFPRETTKGRVIVDELCECNHLRSNHAGIAFAAGHGACQQAGCECAKFSWTGPVLAKQRKRKGRPCAETSQDSL